MKAEGGRPAALFFAGVLAGVLFAAVMAAGAMAGLSQRGVTVEVDTLKIAEQIRSEVRASARRELPRTMEAMRQEVPRRVAAETARRLAESRLDVGGFQVPVPPAVTAQVQGRMEEAVRMGLDLAVKEADLDALAGRIGETAYALAKERLREALSGQTFVVRPWPWFSLPVRVVPKESTLEK